MDARSIAAAVLGVALGLLFVVAPHLVVRAHATGRTRPDRGGGYGSDGTPDDRWTRLVQFVGVVLGVAGLYFGAAGLGLL